ncbi:TraY domain-containing protein [Vibrio mediterranei]
MTKNTTSYLTHSKTASAQGKRKEAAKRLPDHLTRFGVNWEQAVRESKS